MKNTFFLNIGCGNHYHKDWINLDFVSDSEHVIAHNLLKGIPFESEKFDAVYHSHVLEHFTKQQGINLIRECHRVLKISGVLRIAVPDLEQIAKNYLFYLDKAMQGDRDADFRYEWSKMELIDQIARNYSGGSMGKTIESVDEQKFDFIKSRWGMEVQRGESAKPKIRTNRYYRFLKKTINLVRLRYYVASVFVYLFGGKSLLRAFSVGYFRTYTGENHQWMYDRYSLTQLLLSEGFINIKVCSSDQSEIKNFATYNLDMVEGRIRKPDSIFVEAIKP